MNLTFAGLNWIAVIAAIILAQIVSTMWFVVLFAEPWAHEFGAASSAEHTAAIPPYTYAFGLLCTTLLTLGLAVLQRVLGVSSGTDGLKLGAVVGVCFCLATMLPGQLFLDRVAVFLIAGGSQFVMILAISTLLAAWPARSGG